MNLMTFSVSSSLICGDLDFEFDLTRSESIFFSTSSIHAVTASSSSSGMSKTNLGRA